MFVGDVCILVLMWGSAAAGSGPTSFGAEGGIQLQNDSIIIDCRGVSLQRDNPPTLGTLVTATRLVARNCTSDFIREELFAFQTLPSRLEFYNVTGELTETMLSGLQLTALLVHHAKLSDNVLSALPSLTELDLYHVTSPQLAHASHLQRLSLRHCSLRRVPEKLLEAKQLRNLDLSYNHIDYLPPNALSSSARLSTLNLSHNALSTQSLRLAHMHALARLDLSDNNIVKFSFQELRSNESLEVDLRHNPVKELEFTEEDYKRILSVKTNLSVHVDPYPGLTCECLHGWLVHAINETSRLRVHNAHCGNVLHAPLQCADPKTIHCTFSKCVPEACRCRTEWYTGVTGLRCEALTKLPRGVPHIRMLFARGSNITELTSEDLPDSLLMLDLSKNKIAHIDNETASTLLGLPKRRVWLAENPLACDCDNLALFEALAAHKPQVFDYNKIQCYNNETGNGTLLLNLNTEQLCVVDEVDMIAGAAVKNNAGLRLAAAAALGTLFLAIVAVVLHARYGRRLLTWLRMVGWLSVRKDDLDVESERTYDVFVSFSHKDAELVTRELLPRLEREYSVCVHFRDWVVGEWIPTQITRSVAASRRTVVVLSRNFVGSQWARLEFRSALAGAITDGVPRLAVIVLDDVALDDALDDELTNYLRTNTYLRWGDPWFWNKLKVVLPKPRTNVAPPPAPATENCSEAGGNNELEGVSC